MIVTLQLPRSHSSHDILCILRIFVHVVSDVVGRSTVTTVSKQVRLRATSEREVNKESTKRSDSNGNGREERKRAEYRHRVGSGFQELKLTNGVVREKTGERG